MSPRARRVLLIAGAGVLALLVATQLLLPRYLSGRIEDRLTKDGGQAKVTLSALPALRLLRIEGGKVSINATSLALKPELGNNNKPLGRLDGFGKVDVQIADSSMGPVTVTAFDIKRDGSGPYALHMVANVSLADLASYGASQVDSGLGFLLGVIAQGSVPGAGKELAINADMGMASDNGNVKIVSGAATVEGIPVTPVVQLLMQAITIKI